MREDTLIAKFASILCVEMSANYFSVVLLRIVYIKVGQSLGKLRYVIWVCGV